MQDVNVVISNLQEITAERYKQLEIAMAILQEENARLKAELEKEEE